MHQVSRIGMDGLFTMHSGNSAVLLGHALALAVGSVMSSGPAAAQTAAGLVAEHVTLAPVAGAQVKAFLVGSTGEGGGLLEVAQAWTDDEGAFDIVLPGAGTYRLQAQSAELSSPLSAEFSVEAGRDGPHDIALIVPSRSLMLAGSCDLEAEPGAAVVGVARDEESGFPLPAGTVVAVWPDGSGRRAEVSATGHYLLCGVAVGEPVAFRLELLGASSRWTEIEITRSALILHDILLDLTTAERPGATPEEVEIRILEVETGREAVSGILVDADTGEPIADAVVELVPMQGQQLTRSRGQFEFPNVEPGEYALRVEHLAYGVTDHPIRVGERERLQLELALTHAAIGLDGLEVTARSRVEETIRRSPSARAILTGARLAEAEIRGARPVDMLRTVPGLRVRPVPGPGGRSQVAARDGWVRVFVDGIRMDGALDLLNLTEIESMELLGPVEATTRFGLARRGEASSVLLIYTRGKGPDRGDPARNCVGC